MNMLGTILEHISLALQIIASLGSIISPLCISYKSRHTDKLKFRKSSHFSLGHEEVLSVLKWLIYTFFFVSVSTALALLFMDDVPEYFLYSTITAFLIMLVTLFLLSVKGRQTLETRTVLAPKKLWQAIFNRIPSYLEDCDGPLKIGLVDIGVDSLDKQDSEQETQDEDLESDAINNAIAKVKKELRNDVPKDSDNPLYTLTEENLFAHKSDKENIHGIIAFVGNKLAIDEVINHLHFLADKFPDTPVGYVSFGAFPSDYVPPYINLKGAKPKEYINHLIFRYYTRSRAKRSLSKTYRKFFLCLAWILVILLFAIPIQLLWRNYWAENEKDVLCVPVGLENDSNLSRLVSTLLISPAPSDVKIWEHDSIRRDNKPYVNISRFSKQGRKSDAKSDSFLIATVMKAQVFLVYDRNMSCPYRVWDSYGELCKGYYRSETDAFYTVVDGKDFIFKWLPKKTGKSTLDDRRIRAMYSYDGKRAVEIIYDAGNRDEVWKAIRHSDNYLLGIQQFLIAASLKNLQLNDDSENSRNDTIETTKNQGINM